MRLAIHCSNLTWPDGPAELGPTLAGVARAADEGGLTTLTLMDHYFQMEQLGGPAEPMLEGYTALGFLAGQTSNLELGLLVTGVTYRHPGLLAKIATTLDVLSGGRAMLGLGAAWYQREHEGLGVPFPPTAERFERLEETLHICRQMWSEDNGAYAGQHYRLAETVCVPAPLRPGGPRIVIGGQTPNGARLAGRIGDGWTTFDTNFEANLPLYLTSLEASGKRREDQVVLVGFQGDWLGDESVRDSGWIQDPRATWARWAA